MDITTTYDSLKQQLKIKSGTSDTGSKGSGATSSTVSSSSADNGKSLANQLANLGDSTYLSPILQTKAQNEALQNQLTKTLAAKFEDLGIDASQAVTLTRDADGTVRVAGEHPDKDAIEKLFADTPALTEAFNALADNSATLKTMTSRQASSLVRANGYAAYLQQMGSDASTGDFYMSYMNGLTATSFK